MPELDKSAQKLSQKWIFSVVVLIILAFWYSKTANLLPNLPKTSVSNQALLDKAQKAGYKIAWDGNPKDTTGRSIVAEGKRSQELFPDNFYWTIERNAKLKLTGYPVGMGVFKEWVKIPDSNDYYIVLNNPLSKSADTTELGARIIITSSGPGAAKPTNLTVENLDYGFKNKNVAFSQSYGQFAGIDKSTLDKIIKPGDVITIYTIPLNEEQAKVNKTLMLTDNRGIPYALTVAIRRFGGLVELKKELE